ncbi:hypothetical protein RDI58_010295 [Solanum bulbocastanum]|uniref:Uncharacterized protein n=1 Tax=Solanum bulbocastanum TaxID=147425 RepID=A0AAN8YFA9_SOLBU
MNCWGNMTLNRIGSVLWEEYGYYGTLQFANEISDFMQSACMMELKADFTWKNNYVYSRIDRGLVNAAWVQMWSCLEVIVMEPEFSDHFPLSVSLDDRQHKGKLNALN